MSNDTGIKVDTDRLIAKLNDQLAAANFELAKFQALAEQLLTENDELKKHTEAAAATEA